MRKRRRSAKNLIEQRERAIRSAPSLAEVLRGTLQRRYVRCGKPGCHCEKGRGHGPFLYLSVTVGVGRTVQITIGPDDREIAQQYVRNYRLLQRALEKVSEINRELLRQREHMNPRVKRKAVASRHRRRRKKKKKT
jgi:hypothetical protein